MQKEYIEKITELLKAADIDTLDFTYQFLIKSVPPVNPSTALQQSA